MDTRKYTESEMNDNNYVEPKAEIIIFESEDVITTSGGIDLPDDEW